MDAFEDEIGSCWPVKRFCNVVVSVEVFFDRCFQSLDASGDAAPDSFCRDVREESFNLVQPAGASWSEVHVVARVTAKPAFHGFRFVGRVIVYHDMDGNAVYDRYRAVDLRAQI